VTPPGHWNEIALDLVATQDAGTVQVARLFDVLNTAQADAFIACWDAKFTWWSERPVTAIRRELDPAWTPLLATPPFPSYVSGHATTSGAASTVLAHFFPRQADELTAMADEAAESRLYGGIHFPVDNATGLTLGRRVGRMALRGNPPAFVPVG
jgi:membrane-associated phospholipid phosphatase